MATEKLHFEIGEALFSDQPIPVEIEFENGKGTFLLRPLSKQDRPKVAAIQKKIAVAANKRNADGTANIDEIDLEAVVKIRQEMSDFVMTRVLCGWKDFVINGTEITYTEENRAKFAEVHEFVDYLLRKSNETAIKHVEEESKN